MVSVLNARSLGTVLLGQGEREGNELMPVFSAAIGCDQDFIIDIITSSVYNHWCYSLDDRWSRLLSLVMLHGRGAAELSLQNIGSPVQVR